MGEPFAVMSKHSEESAPKKLERVVVEKTGALSPDDTIQTAGDRMRSLEANAWPVAEGRKLVGVIDQTDPDRHAGAHGHDPRTTRVGDTMRHEAVFCYEDQDAAEADRLMEEHHLNHLPVVDRDMKIVGIISRQDVKGEAREKGEHAEADPVQDWKPGEARSLDGHSMDGNRVPGADGSRAKREHEIQEMHLRAQEEPSEDAERFPFRAPDEAEVGG